MTFFSIIFAESSESPPGRDDKYRPGATRRRLGLIRCHKTSTRRADAAANIIISASGGHSLTLGSEL